MADISNEIKNFREAVYGEEVRGSMISLAEKLNEVSEATEAAEKKRVTAENGRVSAETKRQTDTAEAIKKNNAATERANTAASAAETATEETNRATENANAKASLANTAAGKAETAAKSANDAAGSVEAAKNAALEAAELATAEAGKATTAASNANSKASAANTAAEKANTAADRAEKAAEHAEGLVLGDISKKTVTFEMASQRAGVESGDSLAVAFGKLAKYCADLKPHVFVDPVNNLLGTDPKLPLSATQGKALDEKIEGVKADVTKLNGDLVYSQQFIPEIAKNNIITDLLAVNTNGVMNVSYMYPGSVATEDASSLQGSPIKSGAFYAYREVFFIPNQGIIGNTYGKTIIRLTESYPIIGRIWICAYNTDFGKWTDWKSINPS